MNQTEARVFITELDDRLDGAAAKPIGLILDWAEDQFRQLGRRDARELAVAFFAGVQGAALLAKALRDPDIMTSQVRHLGRWIDSLSQRTPDDAQDISR